MKPFRISLGLIAALVWTAVGRPSAGAEQHRATRLGNPATRFAPPLVTPDDLRSRFRDERLKPDFIAVLDQWGWKGNWDDLQRAALSADIKEVQIPVGSVMPFMSSREHGKPICLRNVTWAGEKPAPAYAFPFTSKGRRYRCVTPKACSNFFVEDLGLEPKPLLTLDCTAPEHVLAGRPVQVCLTLRNSGDAPAPKTIVTLTVPAGAAVVRSTEAGVASPDVVTWEVPATAPKATRQLCATLGIRQPGQFSFQSSAAPANGPALQSSCSTKILGVPAILLETVDLEDPIEVGKEIVYEIRVTNQGSAPGTNIRLTCKPAPSQAYLSGSGATPVHEQAGAITTDPLPELAPKAQASWRLVLKATQAADARFKVDLISDQFQQPIQEEESTEQY